MLIIYDKPFKTIHNKLISKIKRLIHKQTYNISRK